MGRYLRQNVIGHAPMVPVSDQDAIEIHGAMSAILECIRFEEEWDIVVGNVFSMEQEVLQTALHDVLFSDLDWHDFNDLRVKLVRLLQNLLSSCRSYLDHSPQYLNKLDKSGALSAFFKAETNRAYDDSFAYRFMEELRNHAQHSGHPIHGTVFDTRRIEHAQGTVWRSVAGATIDLDVLKATKFKKRVLEEAEKRGLRLDPIQMAREYIEKLSQVHVNTRDELLSRGLTKRAAINSAVASYTAAGGNLLALALWEDQGVNQDERVTTVFLNPFDRFDKLGKKNRLLRNFSKQYVSGEILAPKKLS